MFKTASGTLSAAVADAGTFTVSYPTDSDEGSFYLAMGHVFILGQEKLIFPDDFDLTLGTANITVTNKQGVSWSAGAAWTLQLEQPGTRNIVDPVTKKLVVQAAYANAVQINLGAPDAAVSNGVCASQTVTGAGTAALINGSLSNGVLATSVATLDALTGRCLTAAWTNTAIVTITGKDIYGKTLVETSASGVVHYGKKAFKTITSVTTNATITGFTLGTNDLIGLPDVLPSQGHVLAVLANGEKLPAKQFMSYDIDQTRLLAGTSCWLLAPLAGYIERANTSVETAVTTGGDITYKIATVTVVGLTNTIADAAAAGSVTTDVPTTVDGSLTTNWVTGNRVAVEILPGAPFATAGAVNVHLEINTQGIFAAGARTSGGATTTSGDVRGTFKPTIACDGDTVFTLLIALPDPAELGMPQVTV